MAKHKFQITLARLLREINKFFQTLTAKLVRWLLRVFIINTRRWGKPAGFVLPTVALLLLVLSLVVAAMLFRTWNRTEQVVGERQEKIIYNAATPAIDRAKAKLEYMFTQGGGGISGVPSEDRLTTVMLNIDDQGNTLKDPKTGQTIPDNYTLPNEIRIDINGDGKPDNAWYFYLTTDPSKPFDDADNNGKPDVTIAYSIIWDAPNQGEGTDPTWTSEDILKRQNKLTDIKTRAKGIVNNAIQRIIPQVRNGPFFVANINPACNLGSSVAPIEKGWFNDPSNTAILRKNFQIDAIAISDKTNGPVTTLEVQQDRKSDRGNKWGAWFRNDLEIHPGAAFRWNGAMHSDGSLMSSGNVIGYLISAPNSCLYGKEASEITVNIINNGTEANPSYYEGQVISGNIRDNQYKDTTKYHMIGGTSRIDETNDANLQRYLTNGTDSVDDSKGFLPSDISLDPILLFTEDKSQYRVTQGLDLTNPTPVFRDTIQPNPWDTRPFVINQRIYNKTATKPFVDDTYRADDRFGPKPVYGGTDSYSLSFLGVKNGDYIKNFSNSTIQNKFTTLDPVTAGVSQNPQDLGLDGYWERRAWREGLRVIVGQRLELGNTLDAETSLTAANLTTGRAAEALQRRRLKDNLAAVQGTAIYHFSNPNGAGSFPIACLASTVHPGTYKTLQNSATFDDVPGIITGYSSPIMTDFFNGLGTNGLEFSPPPNTYYYDNNWKNALTNLARFAGDYKASAKTGGAFPPTQETAGGIMHPYPEITKWGDFSNLRRVIDDSNLGLSNYPNLSIADKSYVDTAACTLGMLAYNINYLLNYDYTNVTNQADITSINTGLQQDLGQGADTGLPAGSKPEDYIAKLSSTLQPKARLIALKEQVARDRKFGAAPITTGTYKYTPSKLSSDFIYGGVTYKNGTPIDLGCDFAGNKYFGLTIGGNAPTNATEEKNFLRVATSLCPAPSNPGKYPILGYIMNPNTPSENRTSTAAAPLKDPRDYITTLANTYQPITDPNIAAIALTPKPPTTGILPTASSPVAPTDPAAPNNSQYELIKVRGTTYRVAFKDSAYFNGRELMNTRSLNMDISLLKNTVPGTSEMWLPVGTRDDAAIPRAGGIVYAFREDAMREDAIARPSSNSWSGCTFPTGSLTSSASNNVTKMTDCGTNVNNPAAGVDPPNNPANNISPKPVDFYPDPDRLPYGFRLRNAANLARGSTAAGEPAYGLTLVSDNPVAIQGDFNCHSTPSNSQTCGTPIEEFSEPLANDWSNFYDRTSLNINTFGKPAGDQWRATEILSDAVNILSTNFCDGSIEDGILTANSTLNTTVDISNYGCQSTQQFTSYLNQARPNNSLPSGAKWARENPADLTSPIKISPNGNPLYFPSGSTTETEYPKDNYFTLNSQTNAIRPVDIAKSNQRVNAIIVSGIVPSRQYQGYGGMHNFPRFLEDWRGQDLYISGSFIQLNFSTSATGLYDQETWNFGNAAPSTPELLYYYQAPNRQWGFDVALQYTKPGPLAKRLTTGGNARSEFYKELPIDDPYINILRCASTNQGTKIDPSVSSADCT